MNGARYTGTYPLYQLLPAEVLYLISTPSWNFGYIGEYKIFVILIYCYCYSLIPPELPPSPEPEPLGLACSAVRYVHVNSGLAIYYGICNVDMGIPMYELELELIQTQMTQKPMLRAEVGMRVRCANKTSAECIMRGRGIGQNSYV